MIGCAGLVCSASRFFSIITAVSSARGRSSGGVLISSGGVWRLLPTSHLHRKHARAPQRGFASRAMIIPPLTLVAANKSGAEALAWTLGTALGVKYLLNKA